MKARGRPKFRALGKDASATWSWLKRIGPGYEAYREDRKAAVKQGKDATYWTFRTGYGHVLIAAVVVIGVIVCTIAMSASRSLIDGGIHGLDPLGVVYLVLNVYLLGGVIAIAVYGYLRATHSKVVVSRDGMVVHNWRKAAWFLPWPAIRGVIWKCQVTVPSTYLLLIETIGSSGHSRQIELAQSSDATEINDLTEAIVRRTGFTETEPLVELGWETTLAYGQYAETRLWR